MYNQLQCEVLYFYCLCGCNELPHLVEEGTLNMCMVFGCYVVNVFVVCDFMVEGESMYFRMTLSDDSF